jgi:hypothetical protein
MSSSNGLTGIYINTLSNLSFEDDTASALFLRVDGTNSMENEIDMNNYKVINQQDGTSLQDSATINNITTALLSYILANAPVIFANFNANNFRIVSLGAPVGLSDATTVFYVQTLNNLKLSLTGGTMSGVLNMGSNKITNLATPIAGTDASNKDYIDTALGSYALLTDLTGYLKLVGGTMSGNINMGTKLINAVGTPLVGTDATNKTYVDTADNLKLNLTGGTMSGSINMGSNKIVSLGNPTVASDAVNKNYTDNTFLPLLGGTMTGNIAMGTNKITGLGTPTVGTDAVNKTYSDLFLPLTGGTISNNLLLQNYLTIGNTAVNSYPLEITSTAPNLSTAFTSGYTMTTGGTSAITPTLNSTVSLKTYGSIWSQARLIVSSDPRIKTDFQELEIKDSIEIIKRIIPFRYTMIETGKIDLGYSAKQVQSLVPEAVDMHENKIPSMMEYVDVKNQVIRTKKRIDAHQNDIIVFYNGERELRTPIIKKMSKNYIRVDIPDGEYLFFGHVVSDFLTLDYKQINIHLMNTVKNLLERVEKLEKYL